MLFKIRPLMDGNTTIDFTVSVSASFKIRPLMDGNPIDEQVVE